jgi:hypothetical protein
MITLQRIYFREHGRPSIAASILTVAGLRQYNQLNTNTVTFEMGYSIERDKTGKLGGSDPLMHII